MDNKLINNFKKKIKFSIRGAIKIKKNFSPFYLNQLIKEFNKLELPINFNFKRYNLKIVDKKNMLICIKQKFNNNNKNFYINFFYSYGKFNTISTPLPCNWYEHLQTKKFKINYFYSRYLFSLFTIKCFIRSQVFVVKNLIFNNFPNVNNYSILLSLDHELIGNKKDSDNLIDQLKINKIIKKDENIIINSNKFYFKKNVRNKYYVTHSIFPNLNIFNGFKFLLFNFYMFIIFFFYLFSNNFEKIIILEELIYYKYYKYISTKIKKNKYFYSNTNLEYKPFWTYDHEIKNENVFVYFYSSNMEHFQFNDKFKFLPLTSLDILKWKTYIVWDNYQKNYLNKFNTIKSKYYNFNYINWLDSRHISLSDKKNNIGIFDVTPMRISLHLSHGWCIPYYYSKNLYVNFYKDIQFVSSQFKNIQLYRKPKREILSIFINQAFINNVKNRFMKNIISLDSDISIKKIVQGCNIVVCMPFTSPALIAKHYKKNVVYYDPTNTINLDSFHGIILIKNRDDLLEYFKNKLN